YPFRAKLIPLLKESCLARLAFHKQVHHLVIDFASFDTIRQERSKHSELTDLLNLCTNVNRLDIVYDAKFTVLTSTGTRDKQHLQKQNIADDTQRIKCLNFVGFNPNQRCPCCAGKEWDQYLWPLLGSLTSIETITLRNALPTSQVFQTLCENPMLKKIIFHKTMVTLPLRRKKRKIIQTDDTTYSSSQIPSQLWLQVKSIEIYEDIDDVTIPKSRKYLDELA
ncbi:hypothetical protein BDF20DRAFT_805811, partial [Mycotypha africana]|uniref:uncharacterized protein n=1 Tax=Mycotypha africana TaxID=64632 RepID=UPI0022FFCEE6